MRKPLLGLAFALAFSVSSCDAQDAEKLVSSKRMADGKLWTARNLDVAEDPSFCYQNVARHCSENGRLYEWEAAGRACRELGAGWRLPSEEEWRQMAKHYGGVRTDSADEGQAAYRQLLVEQQPGFHASLGGNRSEDGAYARLGDHGFYWTSSESDPGHAWFYNFSRNRASLSRNSEGEKQLGLSVRCVRD